MKTPRSDKAWKAYKHSGNAQHIRSESCRLEAELAEAKADMDDLFKRFREAIEQRQETQSANAFIDAQILDAIKAKLEKCRAALDEGFSVAKESLDYAEQTDDGASGLMARLRHFIALKETK